MLNKNNKISNNMKVLKNASLHKSRSAISNKFKKPSDLQDISQFRSQIEKQLVIAESQLNTVVQSKLDALKRSVDLMDESSEKLSHFSKIIEKIDEKVSYTNTDISKYFNLKRVNNTRENLTKVINQIEYFANIPDKHLKLCQILEEPAKLREVFIETVQLDSLRIALMQEIRSDEIFLRSSVEQYLSSIPNLSRQITQRILSFILGSDTSHDDNRYDGDEGYDPEHGTRDFIDHAILSPADLVTHFEVAEMHQEYYERRKAALMTTEDRLSQVTPPSSSNNDINTLLKGLEMYNMRPKVKKAINAAMNRRVISCFESYANRATEEKTSLIAAMLDAGSDLIKLLVDIINDVDPRIPPHYELVPSCFNVLEGHLTPRLEGACESIRLATVSDIFNMIDWIRYFIEQMERFRLGQHPCCARYMSLIDECLLPEYLIRLRTQLNELCLNIINQGEGKKGSNNGEIYGEIIESADGRQMTSLPEDIFNMIHIQLGIAKDGLPSDKLKDAITTALQVLTEMQRRTHDILSHQWKSYDPLRLCAIINDNRRMQEKTIELVASLVISVPADDGSRELLAIQGRAVADEYFTIAHHAVIFLARWIVLNELEEPVFSRLFTPEWESCSNGYTNLAAVITATFNDYLNDLKRWISPVFRVPLFHQLALVSASHYVMAIRRRCIIIPGAPPKPVDFNNSFRVAELLLIDKRELQSFFAGQEIPNESKGDENDGHQSTSPYATELGCIQSLSQLLVCSHISGVTEEVRALCDRWGLDGLRLVHCAIQCSSTLGSRAERQEMIDGANEVFIKLLSGSSSSRLREYSEEFAYIGDSSADINTLIGSTLSTGQQNQARKGGIFW